MLCGDALRDAALIGGGPRCAAGALKDQDAVVVGGIGRDAALGDDDGGDEVALPDPNAHIAALQREGREG